MLAVSFDEYRDSERSIRERVQIFESFFRRGYACIYKGGMVVAWEVENKEWV